MLIYVFVCMAHKEITQVNIIEDFFLDEAVTEGEKSFAFVDVSVVPLEVQGPGKGFLLLVDLV